MTRHETAHVNRETMMWLKIKVFPLMIKCLIIMDESFQDFS